MSQAETTSPAPVKILAVSFDLATVGQKQVPHQNVNPNSVQALVDQLNRVVTAAAHPLDQNSCKCRDQYVPPTAKPKGYRGAYDRKTNVEIADGQSSSGSLNRPSGANLKKYNVFVIDDESTVEANVGRMDSDHKMIGGSVRLDRYFTSHHHKNAHNEFRLYGGYGRATLFPNAPPLSITGKSAVFGFSFDHPL